MSAQSAQAIDTVCHARDALRQAVTTQRHAPVITRKELSEFGSALVSTLMVLEQLAAVLAEQVHQIDRAELQEQAQRDHPADELDKALEHLLQLNRVLDTAAVEAGRYWESTEAVRQDTDDTGAGSAT